MSENGPREKLKVRMLDVAERILETEGLAALQARRVAADTNCSVGTLYNVFKGGLDDLIIEANDRTLQKLGKALSLAADEVTDPNVEKGLMALALAYFNFAVRHQSLWRAVFEHRMSERQSVPDWYRDNQAMLFALVEKTLADTTPDAGARRRAARTLFSAVHGIVSLALDRKLGEFDATETEAQVRLIVGAVAHGLSYGLAASTGAGIPLPPAAGTEGSQQSLP